MTVKIVVLPRATCSWEEFCVNTPPKSIALDGYVVPDSPKWDEKTLHANFGHHGADVVREATMSTAMQVLFAIKGGLMTRLGGDATIYINDPDQDTAFATWLLLNYKMFEGTQSHPAVNRLLALTDRWDITGGAFPTNLDDSIVETHAWVFEPYSLLRTSGALASADSHIMQNCLDAVHARMMKVMLGQGERRKLNTEAKVLLTHPQFCVVHEIGGNEARYKLFSQGMNAFLSIVARRPDGKTVYSIGRRSRYINFPVPKFYEALNKAENLSSTSGWGGSDIIGGSSRINGSSLSWEEASKIITEVLDLDQ